MRFLYTLTFLFLTLFSYSQTVSVTSLNFSSPSTGTQTFSISCAATSEWYVSAPSWITFDQVNGTGPATITVNVEDNPSVDQSRSDEIYVMIQLTSITVDKWITINQTANSTPNINLSTNTLNVISNYDEKTNSDIDINSNFAWTATMDSWLELYLNNSQINSGTTGPLSLQVKSLPNPSSNPRTGTITFSTGNTTKTLTVNQDGSVSFIKLYNWDGSNFIPFSSDTLRFNWDDTTFTANPTGFSRLYITNNVNWTTSVSDESWLTDVKSSTAGYAVDYWDLNSRLLSHLRIAASSNKTGNSRFSTLTFSANGFTKKIVIAQSPKSVVSLSTPSINVGGSTAFTITSNNSWTATMDSWLGLTLAASGNLRITAGDITSGSAGSTNLNVVADPNPTTSARTGTITFTSGSVSKVLTVTQAGATTTSIFGGASTQANDFIVYPNPSNGVIHVKAYNVKAINIFNEIGNVTTSESIEQDQTFELESGFYFVEVITTNDNRSVKKVIVN